MENQHRKVAGYRELTQEDIQRVNELKATEFLLLERLETIKTDFPDYDGRWLAIARTHIEQGFMAAIRSITRPEYREPIEPLAGGGNSDSQE